MNPERITSAQLETLIVQDWTTTEGVWIRGGWLTVLRRGDATRAVLVTDAV